MAIEIEIPKRIAGVKIGKKIRRRAKKTLKAAAGPAIQGLAQAALFTVRPPRGGAWQYEQSERKETDHMCDTRIHIDGQRVAEAFRNAAINGLRTFLEGLEDGLREAKEQAAAKAAPEPEVAPKAKPRPRRAKPKASAGAKPAGAARGGRARP